MALLDFLQNNKLGLLMASQALLEAGRPKEHRTSNLEGLGQGLLGFAQGSLKQRPFDRQNELEEAKLKALQDAMQQKVALNENLGALGGMLQANQGALPGQEFTPQDFAQQALNSGVPELQNFGLKGVFPSSQNKASIKAFEPITLVNHSTGEKRLVSPTVDPITGLGKLSPFDVPKGFTVSKETPAEKRAFDILAQGQKETQKVTAKSAAQRQQSLINTGLESADSMANIKRSIELLNSVKTGGFNSAALRAKQLFGVEGADEAELSANLGKAVLAQLRPIFGSQFTEREGGELKRIEAGFGKSTEGNKRLLEQAKRIIERVASRGIRAAKRAGDLDAAKEIEEALKFSLNPPKVDIQSLSDDEYEARKKALGL